MGKWFGKIFAPQTGTPPAGFFAATNGSATGDGTIGDPWTLAVALAGGFPSNTVQPSDTVWLRGGTYSGVFSATMDGNIGSGIHNADGKIHIKQYPGEIAVIDGGTNNIDYCLQITGTYMWFWDFTVTSSSTDRVSTSGDSYPADLQRPYDGIQILQSGSSGTGCKWINMIVKNCGQGFGLWVEAANAEAYGCLVYYNGWDGSDRSHGHSFYSQNQAPSMRWIRDTIAFANYNYQMHAYTGSSYVQNQIIDGNINYFAGVLSSYGEVGTGEWVMGGNNGGGTQSGCVITNNAVYKRGQSSSFSIEYGLDSPVIQGNYVGGDGAAFGYPLYLDAATTGTPVIGGAGALANYFYYYELVTPANAQAAYPNNHWYTDNPNSPPGAVTWTLVRPNLYAAGRGNVAIFNYSHANTINVDVSSVLTNGDSYEIRHAANFRGTAVASGTYGGGTISFPMTGLTCETPAGAGAPSYPSPAEFAAFVVLKV